MARINIEATDQPANSRQDINDNFTELYASKDALEVVVNSASSSAPASIDLHEDTDNGTNKITITAPSAVASDKTITLPDASGTLALLEIVYPIGSLYVNYSNSANPSTYFGFGTWVKAAEGRVPVGISTTDTEFDTAGETGGEKTHLLTGAESGEKGHNHTQNAHAHTVNSTANVGINPGGTQWGVRSGSESSSSETATNNAVAASNASSAHNNLQPYEVYYMWRRTA